MEVYTYITFIFVPTPEPRAVPVRPRADDDSGERQQPREQPEAVLRRGREHGRPELRDQLLLDLALRVARRDPAADVDALAVGERRVRHVERHVALDAHHLALELRERRMLLAGEGGRREDERERREHDEQA